MTGEGDRRASRELVWEETTARVDDGRHVRTFRTQLPEDWIFFEGHFRGYPVLAGVVQLHELVLPCLRRARDDVGELRALTGLKFPARIAPGDAVAVTLRYDDGSPHVDFEIKRGDVRCTHGRLSMTVAAGADER